jgi:hypothetical protein
VERVESFADPRRELKRYYRTRWRAMLEVMLDWPPEVADRWSWHVIDRVGDNALLNHEHAGYYVERVLARDTPREVARLGSFRSAMLLAVHADEPDTDDMAVIREWLRRARQRVAALLVAHGGRLPVFDAQRDGW